MHRGCNVLRSIMVSGRTISHSIHTSTTRLSTAHTRHMDGNTGQNAYTTIGKHNKSTPTSDEKEDEEHFNEPSGILFGIPEGGRLRDVMSPLTWIFLVGFLGGTALFIGLWQYRPDTSAEAWAKRTALRRMRERGVDMTFHIDD